MRTGNTNIFQATNCLTQDELVRYHQNKMSESEKHLVECHLTDCELCSDALEGVALLPDMRLLENITDGIAGKYTSTSIEKKLFFNPRIWYAAASVVILFVFGSVFFNYLDKETNQVSDNAAIQKVLNNSDQAVVKSTPVEFNEQKAVIGDTVVKIVSNASRKVTDKSYETEEKYSNKREQQLQSPTIFSTTNQLPQGSVVYKDEKLEVAKEDMAFGGESEPVVKTNDLLRPELALAKSVTNYKMYNYNNTYNLKTKKDIETNKARTATEQAASKSVAHTDNEYLEMGYEVLITAALSEYGNKNYKQALKKLDHILDQHPDDVNALYYSALCHKELKEFKKALKYLDKLRFNTNQFFDQDTQFQRALIFIEQKETAKAKLLLQKIMDANGLYREQAKDKLKLLEN